MIIYGASGHAKVIDSILQKEVDLFIDDDNTKTTFLGKPVLPYNPETTLGKTGVIAIGNNTTRKKIAETIQLRFSNVVAQSCILDSSVKLGVGNQLIHGSAIQAGSILGNHVIVNTNASIDHDCTLEDFVHIAPNSTLCGNVTVGEGSLVGAGAVVMPGIKIGKWCTIGAGSVIINDTPDGSTIVGNPGRIVKTNE